MTYRSMLTAGGMPRPSKLAARLTAHLALACALGIAGVALTAAPASAQMAAALGKPLPSPDLAVGTVSVRVVAGSAAAPVVGTEVTLVVNGTPRVARTDAAGRASFVGLPSGATVIAHVADDEKTDHPSDSFAIPAEGGTRVMITTKPWQSGAAGAAPFAGGGAGMPNPRQLSGEARPEQGDAPGMITVRVSYDSFQDTPEGVPVVLVGYAADDTISHQVAKTDKAGRVQFTKLDRSGGTSYFAMTQLPRNGAIDRLTSQPMILESQMGLRLVLSSEKRDSQAPPIDDLSKAEQQDGVPAGKVRVVLEGPAEAAATITLFDVATKQPIASSKPESPPPDPTNVQSMDQFTADPKLPAGTLDVEIGGGAGQAVDPLRGIEIRVVPAASKDDAAGGLASVTSADGTVRMALQTTGSQKAVFVINGRTLSTRPFEITKSGGKLQIRANWEATGKLQSLFDATGAGRVVYAEAVNREIHYRSLPFQLREASGSKVAVYIYPRILFRFLLQAFIDDELLAVQGRLEIMNSSWTPYRAGPDGLLVPLPRGFKGGVVFDPDQPEVSVAAGEGFRIVRPIPPGGRRFNGGFSLPVENGKVAWALDLPLGAFQSEVDIKQTPGMKVNTVGNLKAETRTVPQGTYAVIAPITIMKNQSMHMTIEDLPSIPAWRKWVPRAVGVLVVGVMLAGIAYALLRKQPAAAVAVKSSARRQQLLDELVALERSGGNPKRREQLLDQLEELWT